MLNEFSIENAWFESGILSRCDDNLSSLVTLRETKHLRIKFERIVCVLRSYQCESETWDNHTELLIFDGQTGLIFSQYYFAVIQYYTIHYTIKIIAIFQTIYTTGMSLLNNTNKRRPKQKKLNLKSKTFPCSTSWVGFVIIITILTFPKKIQSIFKNSNRLRINYVLRQTYSNEI